MKKLLKTDTASLIIALVIMASLVGIGYTIGLNEPFVRVVYQTRQCTVCQCIECEHTLPDGSEFTYKIYKVEDRVKPE